MAKHRMVFLDVDTQADFLLPEGKLYVPGAEKLLPALRRITEFAAGHDIPILTSTDAHATDDAEFRDWPAHCVRQTPGQLKMPETLLADYLVVPQERQAPVTDGELARYRQWILEKDDLDLFTNPQADDLVRRLDGGQYIVYGVATEYCVRLAALGLRKRGCRVLLLTDAIQGIEAQGTARALQELADAGAEFAATERILTAAAA